MRPAEQRPGADEYAAFYASYIERVPHGDLVAILGAQLGVTRVLLDAVPEERAGYAYAPGKWTIRQVVGHLADVERMLSARALRFARGDATPLPGFDENAYAEQAGSDQRTLPSLLDELEAARESTVALFAGLPDEAWTRRGMANGSPVSVRALACIITGHELHHREILRSRYAV